MIARIYRINGFGRKGRRLSVKDRRGREGKEGNGLTHYALRFTFHVSRSTQYAIRGIPFFHDPLDAATYLATGNPLAFAFAAQMKRGDWSKGRLKYECLSRIVRCQVNEARRSLLINWVQTYLALSETEQQEFEAMVTASPLTEEVRTMLLTYEGKMIQKGIQQGIQQAKQQTLLDQLQTKFGQLPAEIPQRVFSMEQIEELNQLLRQVITANSLDDMGLNHYANRGNEDKETQRSEN